MKSSKRVSPKQGLLKAGGPGARLLYCFRRPELSLWPHLPPQHARIDVDVDVDVGEPFQNQR